MGVVGVAVGVVVGVAVVRRTCIAGHWFACVFVSADAMWNGFDEYICRPFPKPHTCAGSNRRIAWIYIYIYYYYFFL